MPRLTRWNGKKWILPQGAWREIADRLAAYENTGLEPEEVATLRGSGTDQGLQFPDEPILSAALVIHDSIGTTPDIDTTVRAARWFYVSEGAKHADNPEALRARGINHIVADVYRDHWHIIQVTSYTPENGLCVKHY